MDSKSIKDRLDTIREEKDEVKPSPAVLGRVYISVEGTLYLVDRIDTMVQRDEMTVVCPIIVAGRRV